MQNVVDDVSLRLRAAAFTGTDIVVLIRLDSGARERESLAHEQKYCLFAKPV